jgi:hypothetical protein
MRRYGLERSEMGCGGLRYCEVELGNRGCDEVECRWSNGA